MVFNVVAANCDDYTKNFGFLMTVADRFEVPFAKAAVAEVVAAVNSWSQFAAAAEVPAGRAHQVAADLVAMRLR